MTPLDCIARGFPGRAAFDTAVSRALLDAVARGELSETLRLYRPDDVVAFSGTDAHRPGFRDAVAAARAAGFDASLRLAGGSAALFTQQSLAFGWCRPDPEPRAGIHERFAEMADLVAGALRDLGVDAQVGAVPGEYCPGDYSVNDGRGRKLMGVGQRIVRGAAWVGGVIVVGGAARADAVLEPVYRALGLPYTGRATGAVEDAAGAEVDVDTVRDALLARIASERGVAESDFAPAVLEAAARGEARHRV
ncbi:MAG: lipoyl protein ligase domain-containing protein [Myxococcota bacterium]